MEALYSSKMLVTIYPLIKHSIQVDFSHQQLCCESWSLSWIISLVKPTRCPMFEFIEYHSTCPRRSFCPSSGVQDCTHTIRYMSYRLVDCLPASKQSTNPYDIYLMLCVQSWTPDDGQKDCPKHVEWYSINSKIVHLVGLTIEIYHDARSHERQILSWVVWLLYNHEHIDILHSCVP
jgi:hypothetical protein